MYYYICEPCSQTLRTHDEEYTSGMCKKCGEPTTNAGPEQHRYNYCYSCSQALKICQVCGAEKPKRKKR